MVPKPALATPTAEPKSSAGYRLPFNGQAKIFQGPKCKPSHQGTEAIDFGLGDGTPVYAAMGGFIRSGWDSKIVNGMSFGNYIEIHDSAGNTAIYGHLSKIIVKSGRVRQGQLIGLSGNSTAGDAEMGYHLHFEVRGPNWEQVSIRNLPGIVWVDPKQPCQPEGIDGMAYGPEPISELSKIIIDHHEPMK